MLRSLTIKNFKSWKSIDAMRLAPITGLFGANSSGKSSILHALLLMKQSVESTDRSKVLEFGGPKCYVDLGSFREAVHGKDNNESMVFGIQWEPDGDPESHEFHRRKKVLQSNSFAFSSMISGSGDEGDLLGFEFKLDSERFTFSSKPSSVLEWSSGSEEHENKAVLNLGDHHIPHKFFMIDYPWNFADLDFDLSGNVQWAGVAGMLTQLGYQFEMCFEQVQYLGPLRSAPQREYRWAGNSPRDIGSAGERAIDTILASSKHPSEGPLFGDEEALLAQVIAEKLQELDLIHSFRTKELAEGSMVYQVLVKKNTSSAEVLLPDVGFGVSQILPILVLCYSAEQGSTILLEQPEIHLHPSVQSGLADILIDVATNRGVQIIVESHSEHLLNRLQLRLAEEKLKPEKLALYFCENGDQGSELRSLEIDEYGSIHNWPKDFFGDQFGESAKTQVAAMKRKLGKDSDDERIRG